MTRLLAALLVGSGYFSFPTFGASTPDPGTLPLLRVKQSIGVLYTEIDPLHQDAIDIAFGELLDRGMHGYEASTDWIELVNDDWTMDTSTLEAILDGLSELGLTPYLSIATIDTNNLQIPFSFRNPDDERELGSTMSWDDPAMISRFGELLDAIVPILVEHGGYYLAIGNEVDIWLNGHPDQIQAYAAFVDAARTRVHTIAPQLAVGTTLTGEVLGHPEISGPLIGVSDAVSYTYYHMVDGQVLAPDLFPAVLDAMVELAGDKQIVFQEVGYPSGWATDTTIGSSVELQQEFVRVLFPAMASHEQIRFWSFLHVGDWGEDLLAIFEEYYGISSPEFIEYLGTLGLIWNDGTPKPAYQEFLMGLGGCAVDITGDGLIDTDDLYAIIESPVDINGDGAADEMDAKCLEKYLRRFELRDLNRQP
ncbi:MAG: hypothetical protein ACWA5W_10670 [Phycisphaerales bacterium]